MQGKIEGLINNVFDNLKTLVDVDQVVGKPIKAEDAIVVPFSKVSFAFLAGGGEYSETSPKAKGCDFPYAGGSGGGAIINPIGFLVLRGDKPELVKIDKEDGDSKWGDMVAAAFKLIGK